MHAPVILWFRRDLRLADNPALAAAAQTGAPVIPVFILDEAETGRPPGGAARWWLGKSLAALDRSLRTRGSRLILRRGDAAGAIADLAAETGAGAVLWNRLYEPEAVQRDHEAAAGLARLGAVARDFKTGLLNEPGDVRNGAGEPYRVFTAYWRTARTRVSPGRPSPAPEVLAAPEDWPSGDRLATWGLAPTRPDWSRGFSDWTPGEAGAQARLHDFMDGGLSDYAMGRNRLLGGAISRLSPHLHWGEIGPRQVMLAVQGLVHAGRTPEAPAEAFIAELGWREFAAQLLVQAPDMATRNLRPAFDRFAWRDSEADFAAWTRGRTGYPVVDAAMRELWATGFMPGRARMIVASFLAKHLLIDWRRGEAWFWDTLVDADLASNAMNWQWSAGSGVDAQPFFRIFNPVSQGRKFDPGGDYVRRWVPELAALPGDVIHAPWTADPVSLAAAGVRLGDTYPHPIVDHALARARALEALAASRRVSAESS